MVNTNKNKQMFINSELKNNRATARLNKENLKVMINSFFKNIVKAPKLIFKFYKNVYVKNAEFMFKGNAVRNFNGF